MHTIKFNEWEIHPVHLTTEEINKPLLVIADFFHDDWLPNQLERLKTWRDYVLKEGLLHGREKQPCRLASFL
jgi:hypothetical protein